VEQFSSSNHADRVYGTTQIELDPETLSTMGSMPKLNFEIRDSLLIDPRAQLVEHEAFFQANRVTF
jgi:hypothetical protein